MNLHLFMICIFMIIFMVSCTANQPITLKDAFKDKFLIGTALTKDQILGKDPKSLKVAIEQFNVITPENILKWEKVHPQPGVYNFGLSDSLIAFAEKNNMLVIGHTLVWNNQTPAWVFQDSNGQPVSRDTLLKRLKDHIFTVVGKYKGKIYGWDVINEAFDDDGNFSRTNWRNIIGEDYLEHAFRWAHEADPDAELYYNDFNMWYKGRRDAVVKMVNNFKVKNIPIHGIGLQGHWGLNYPTNDELNETFEIYSGLGINLMVTELELDMLPRPEDYEGADINLNYEARKELDPWPDGLPDSMQTVVADRYAEIFSIFNKYSPSISRITVWGVHDGQSWRNYWPIYSRTAYPLLFDRNLQPKKAYFEVIKTVQ
jgi:endo-1,4-beta-xylanase